MLEGMGNRPSGDPKIRAKDIFSSIDLNNDGTLTVEEFVKGDFFLFLKTTNIFLNENFHLLFRVPDWPGADEVAREDVWDNSGVPGQPPLRPDKTQN